MYQRVRSLAALWLVIGMILAACGSATSAATAPTASPTTSSEDRRATARAVVMPTQNARATIEALMPTQTPLPTHTAASPASTPLPPIPAIDFKIDVPYLQDGGALPSGAVARIGIGKLYEAAVYPDRSAFLLATSTGLYTYRVDTFERIWRRYLEHSLWNMSLSKDGRRVVTEYGWDSDPVLFDAQSGNRVDELAGWHEAQWSPDGRFLAVEAVPDFDYDGDEPIIGQIGIYDSGSGRLLRTVETPVDGFFGGVFSVVQWSPDGRYLAACGDSAVYAWDASTTKLVHTIGADSTTGGLYLRYCGIAFSTDSRYLAIQDSDVLFVVDMETGQTVFEPGEAANGGTWLMGHLFLMFEDNLKVFDSGTWDVLYQSEDPVSDLALSPSGQQIVLEGRGVSVLDSATFDIDYTIASPGGGVYWSPDGRWLVRYQGEKYYLYDRDTVYISLNPQDGMTFVDDQRVLTLDGDRVMLVDLTAGNVTAGMRTGLNVSRVAWSQDGRALMMTTPDGDWYWTEATGQVNTTLPDSMVFTAAAPIDEGRRINQEITLASPDGRFSAKGASSGGCGDGPWGGACGIFSGKLEIYEGISEHPFKTIEFPGSGPTVLTWSADNRLLAIGLGAAVDSTYDDRIIVLDIGTGQELFSFEGHLDDISSLVFSPNGMRLASISEDGTVIVWNTGH